MPVNVRINVISTKDFAKVVEDRLAWNRVSVDGWPDSHIPRAKTPLRFDYMPVVGTIDEDGWYADSFISTIG